MQLDKFVRSIKNLGVILVAIAGAVASLEKLSQLDLKIDEFESKDSEK